MSGGPAGAARFVPLTCAACGADLLGRARDVTAYCRTCRAAFTLASGVLQPLAAEHVDAGPGAALCLPFWVRGATVTPAFLSGRTLVFAHTATRQRAAWRIAPGLADPLPVGARLPPETLGAIADIAGLPPGSPAEPARLLAVPAFRAGRHWRLPGVNLEFVDDDIAEADALLALVAPGS